MSKVFQTKFELLDMKSIMGQAEGMSDAKKYHLITEWAVRARNQNPGAFDQLTKWILDDSQWEEDQIAENKSILMEMINCLREQNDGLRAFLQGLKDQTIVNQAVYETIDRFQEALEGRVGDELLRSTAAGMFSDFTVMCSHEVRKRIAGDVTGPEGVNGGDYFGYVNCLKDSDAQVQWTLFMPEVVQQQQQGFQIERFEYQQLPSMRFIGKECDQLAEDQERKAFFKRLDDMEKFKSGFNYDLFLMHHYGISVDVGAWHGFWGRFMKADTPVPEGCLYFDFVEKNDGKQGAPFCSKFAFSVFSGDPEAMHQNDSQPMYDITRNIILSQGVGIPYPAKYWTAEVFMNGQNADNTGYLFSAE